MGPYRSDGDDQPLVEVIYQKRFLARGPKIAALGGGHGLSTLLRGLKEHTSNLTAIVTVADDGGSSGKLRDQLGLPAVGDIRNCLVALADAEPQMSALFQYRFPGEDGPTSLAGHAIGNLLIAAMTAVEDGDFEEGVRRMNRVLAVRGQVVPATATPVVLHAALRDGSLVEGQSRIARMSGIDRVWLSPEDVRACDDALAAIAEADVIVIGPGSLFTSLLPSLLLPDIRQALADSPALRIYVCNVATQTGETDGFDLADHVEALERHTADGLIDIVLANNRTAAASVPVGDPRVGPPALAAGRVAAGPAGPRRRGRPGQPVPSRSRAARRRDRPDRRTGGCGQAPERRRPERVSAADRDLVAALRAELAAIDPQRACDRAAESAGLGPGLITREASIARLAVRLGRETEPAGLPGSRRRAKHVRISDGSNPLSDPAGGARPAPTGFDWERAADHCRWAWLRGRFLARGSLSLSAGRAHLEFVVPAAEAPVLADRLAEVELPAAWRIRRGRGVVTWKNAETIGTFLRRIGAASAILELEARQVSRALRGELNRVINAESANLQRAVVAAGRQLAAIGQLEADGRLADLPRVVRLAAAARRATPEATLAELSQHLELHRSTVQRALERIEELAADPDPTALA